MEFHPQNSFPTTALSALKQSNENSFSITTTSAAWREDTCLHHHSYYRRKETVKFFKLSAPFMKIKALSRSSASVQAPGSGVSRQTRNLDPTLHAFEKARTYTRALNATKLERMFAKPFVAQLGRGHVDGVYTLANDPRRLDRISSASGDGIIKIWNLETREEVWHAKGHDNIVKSTCWTNDDKLLSCGSREIKLWDPYNTKPGAPPVTTYLGQNTFSSLSHHRSLPIAAASSSSTINMYDLSRPSNAPIQTLHWQSAVDSITSLAFNQVETSILASTAIDRSIVLYDLRTSSPLSKTTLTLASNAISWNPMEAFNFAVANEDHSVYMFDMRRIDRALNVFKGHVAAVMDVSFDPTGVSLVSAGYDRTIRLWDRSDGQSRDVYHTKRMQRVFAARFTSDSTYVVSGSDDGNIRLWRAHASKTEGVKSAKQRQKLEYDATLIERYKHMPEIRRINRHRHVPKQIKKAGEIKGEELKSIKRREENERKNSKKGLRKRRSEREKMILANEQ